MRHYPRPLSRGELHRVVDAKIVRLNAVQSCRHPVSDDDLRRTARWCREWHVWKRRLDTAWPELTRRQREVAWDLVSRGRSISVGHDEGDEVRPVTARRLVAARLAITHATGEFAADGPYVFLSVRRDVEDA